MFFLRLIFSREKFFNLTSSPPPFPLKVFIYIYLAFKSVRIRSYSGPYFPAFGLNTERYGLSFRIQSERGKIRTINTPITHIYNTVLIEGREVKIFSTNITKNNSPHLIFNCYERG